MSSSLNIFAKQKVDEAGHLAVKFQLISCAGFLSNLFAWIFSILFLTLYRFPIHIIFGFLYIVVFIYGFYSSYRRKIKLFTLGLLGYCIVMLGNFGSLVQISVELHEVDQHSHRNKSSIMALGILLIITNALTAFFLIFSIIIGFQFRKLLLRMEKFTNVMQKQIFLDDATDPTYVHVTPPQSPYVHM